ncbi:MAG TPA: redoxin domain-containing protein [Pyrinomonadaceae bacterium]|jgi:thiol-disulfide isomerase/thioredoxin/uncharacterized membrane protein YphA (DoxX/SURF4 family)|nr:redoxin domain-containing protein [Pyrinomonadaceae bacterium]
MEIVLLLIRVFLAAIFFIAGGAKLYDLEGSEKAARDFGVPEGLAKPVGIILPLAEIAIAISLLPLNSAWYGGIAALVLLTVFTIGMSVQIAKGQAPDCHCFGQIYSEPVGRKSILRNVFLMLAAAVLVIAGRVSPGQSFTALVSDRSSREYLISLIGVLAIALIFRLLAKQREMSAKLLELRQEIDTLQMVSEATASGHVHHEHMTSPDEGLPIGAVAPDFKLPDMKGRAVSFEQLMTAGRAMLFFFISPTCAPCKALLPEIGKWQEELAGKVDFIFVSSGSVEENAEKLYRLGGQIHLLQNKREVAELFKVRWTPTAVLVNAGGLIASRLAPGDTAMKDLVDLIKENGEDLSYVKNGRGMSPNDLKIGEELPEFELPAAEGRKVTDEIIRGKKTLALFWGLDCPYCQRMLPELKDWENSGANGVQLVVFSSGDAKKNRELNLRSPVVIDDDGEIGIKLGMYGTPSAILIDESGKVASETAIGSEQIWSLIGKRK